MEYQKSQVILKYQIHLQNYGKEATRVGFNSQSSLENCI